MTASIFLVGTEIATTQLQVQNYISLWRIMRVDGVQEYYTSHDEDLTLGILESVRTNASGINADAIFGVATFLATTGLTASASRRETGLRSQTFQVAGVIGGLDLTKLEGGRYDMAEVTEWRVDSRWPFFRWFETNEYVISGVGFNEDEFSFDAEGLGRLVRENFGNRFGRTCRWSLGRDDKGVAGKGCGQDRSGSGGIKLDILDFTWITCSVIDVARDGTSSNRMAFNIIRAGSVNQGSGTPTIPLGRPYKYGTILWTTGANAGLKYDIGDYNQSVGQAGWTGQFASTIEMENEIQIGDQCTIEEGCDNTFGTCFEVYGNPENFGGYHLTPGPTRAGQSPRVRWSS